MSTAGSLLLVLALAKASKAKQQHSYREQRCLQAAVYYEARGEGLEGMEAVRKVVLNRAREQEESVCRTVARKHQFSFFRRGINLNKPSSDKNFLTAYSKSFKVRSKVGGEYLFYFRKDIEKPLWSYDLDCNIVVKNHIFCRVN